MKMHYIFVVFVEVYQNWFYLFTMDVDSDRKEATAYIKFFEMWLNQKKIVSKGLFLFTFNYWHRSFRHNLYCL